AAAGVPAPGVPAAGASEAGASAAAGVPALNSTAAGVPTKIRKRVISDLDKVHYPKKTIVPYTEIVHDRVILELFRGCTRGCRFCQAGHIYRPVREKNLETLVKCACELIDSTGYEDLSLLSLSTSDYTQLKELTDALTDKMAKKRVSLSLPSLRVDSFSLDLMEKAHTVRKSGLTFAPEAGTQRLRDVINKGVTEEDLIKSVSLAFSGGWSNIKLYFMIGLPTETFEDLDGIADLAEKVVREYSKTPKEVRGRGLNVTVSVSPFVPKPFTPFQWEAQDSIDLLDRKQQYIRDVIVKQRKLRHVTYNWHDPKTSFIEAVFARGDKKIGKVIYEAWKLGCKFDGWREFFSFDSWMAAFEKCGVNPEFYANRLRERDEIFPWDHMDYGISMEHLWRERCRAYTGEVSPDCRTACSGCGVEKFFRCPKRSQRE
ncbi:MAG: TIGR03960 family B12-binding radical SAM protein, partial [Oscillospiraceae bacterium]|nr:TIGR03960 family B12-binding radical SAM protein [Oscillospiraceae bacterium]